MCNRLRCPGDKSDLTNPSSTLGIGEASEPCDEPISRHPEHGDCASFGDALAHLVLGFPVQDARHRNCAVHIGIYRRVRDNVKTTYSRLTYLRSIAAGNSRLALPLVSGRSTFTPTEIIAT